MNHIFRDFLKNSWQMTKKKRKIFQKSQLLSLFHNQNYQKVISKIKQFEIEGMSIEELRKIVVIVFRWTQVLSKTKVENEKNNLSKKDELFGNRYTFEIPNYVIKILYFNYFSMELKRRNNLKIEDMSSILTDLALGKLEPFKTQLNIVIKTLSNRDHYGFTEKHFQVITLSLLSFAEFYFIDSQPELDNKYPDILLMGRDENVPNNYLFELKWVKQKDDYAQLKKRELNRLRVI